jgi:DNA-binding PadR family transcriptional regulator
MERKAANRQELLSGTLDMLILKSLSIGVRHGYGIAQHVRAPGDTESSFDRLIHTEHRSAAAVHYFERW